MKKLTAFSREDRYIVIKRKHLSKEVERQLLVWLNAAEIRQVPKAVVVEGDWPEYEPVWKMIEDRVAGKAQEEAPPRDDVREASTYERLGQMLRRENLKPTARFLEAAYLGYNLCRMERDGRIARHEGSGTGSAI